MHPHYCTAVYKLIERLSAWKFVSCSEKYRTSSERKFGLKWTERSERSLEPCSIANCGRMVTDSAMVTMESLWETTIALSNGAIADPLRPRLPPQMGFHMPPPYANGRISATGDPIHFMFGSRVGFSRGRRIERRYLRFKQIQDGGHRHVGKNFIYLRNRSSDPLHVLF